MTANKSNDKCLLDCPNKRPRKTLASLCISMSHDSASPGHNRLRASSLGRVWGRTHSSRSGPDHPHTRTYLEGDKRWPPLAVHLINLISLHSFCLVSRPASFTYASFVAFKSLL